MDVGIVNPFPADHFKINNKNDNPKIIVGVVLLHFQEPATRKNCNTNVTIQNKFFGIYFPTKYKFFYIKK